jgi:hypothetical protein
MGHSNDRKWWIVSLNVLVKATTGGGAGGKLAQDIFCKFTHSFTHLLNYNL